LSSIKFITFLVLDFAELMFLITLFCLQLIVLPLRSQQVWAGKLLAVFSFARLFAKWFWPGD